MGDGMDDLEKEEFTSSFKDLSGIVSSGPIILVDDSEDFRFLFNYAYGQTKKVNPLVMLHSGGELIEHMGKVERAEEPMPELILLDINMPGLDGFDVLKDIRLREEFKNIPIIVMFTSSTSRKDCEIAKEHGADGFITKPNRIDDYIKMIETL